MSETLPAGRLPIFATAKRAFAELAALPLVYWLRGLPLLALAALSGPDTIVFYTIGLPFLAVAPLFHIPLHLLLIFLGPDLETFPGSLFAEAAVLFLLYLPALVYLATPVIVRLVGVEQRADCRWGREETRYLQRLLLLVGASLLPPLVPLGFFYLLDPFFHELMEQGVYAIVPSVLLPAAALSFAVAATRLSLLLPGAAVGRGYGLRDAWRESRAVFRPLLLLLSAVFFLGYLLARGLPFAEMTGAVLVPLSLLANILLALAYGAASGLPERRRG